jgi:Mn2+/Fe2+ NRAMP family transporter
VVTAAFIGPGTVTTATLAGARFGTDLLWTLAFATVATILLQEMAARLGLTTSGGLGKALRRIGGPRWLGATLAALAALAVVSGAAAYEAGNLTGAGLGLAAVTGLPWRAWVAIGTVATGLLLWTGRYRLLERVLVACVAVMGLIFLATAIMVAPRLETLFSGAVVPRVPAGAEFNALALIGTTIVPYNLFLHAAAVRERWSGAADLRTARLDLVLAIGLGGVVSGAIVVTASAALGGAVVGSASDMASQLTPLLGPWAGRGFAAGYAAAGISSAITAPLAAAYTVMDTLERGSDVRARLARGVWIGCVAVGAVTALASVRPVALIFFAQVVNGLVLPIVALVLLIAMNDRARLGAHANGPVANLAGILVVLLAGMLGGRAIVLAL